MKVAVTGAGGFIGGHLVRHLNMRGHEVVPLGRDELAARGGQQGWSAPDGPAVETIANHLEGVEAVAHLAARSQRSPDDPLAVYLEPNVVLSESLLIAAARVGVHRVVLASTRLAYPPDADPPTDELVEGRPATLYGLSKKLAEQLLAYYGERHGFGATSLRLGQVFGPGDGGRGVLPRFIQDAREGRDLEVLGEGAAVRDFVHVEDVASAFELALTRTPSSPIINIGGGGHTIREFAEAVAAAVPHGELGVRHRAVDVEDRTVYSMSCARAASELGWRPRPLAETIRDYLGDAV